MPSDVPSLPPPEAVKPRRSRSMQLRRILHRLTDPARSLPAGWRAAATLHGLADGEYRAIPGSDVPYICQFASPALVNAYIHQGLHGRSDPNWKNYGAPDVDQYTFWAHRACAIACLKMAIDAFSSAPPSSMWALIEEGIALGGYQVYDEGGNFIDMGWFHEGIVKLGARHGLTVIGKAYTTLLEVCDLIRQGWLVAPAVSPQIGEMSRLRDYDGHFVLAYGFRWQRSAFESLIFHNPSGRVNTLQADVVMPAHRARYLFAHRYMAFRPATFPNK